MSIETPRVSLKTPRLPLVPRTNQTLEPVKKLYTEIPQENLREMLRKIIPISVKPSYSTNVLKTPRVSLKTPRVPLEIPRVPRTNQTLEQVNTLKLRIPQETLRVMLRTSTQISVEPSYWMNGLKIPRVPLKTPRVFLETSQVSTKTPRVPLEIPRVSPRTPRVPLETPRLPRTNQILEPVKKLYIRIPQETLRVMLRTFILTSVKPSYSMNGLKPPRMSTKTPRVSLETPRVSLKIPRVSLVPRTNQTLEQMKKLYIKIPQETL